VVSEEAPEPKSTGEYYWLVDPLDGTKDFLAHNDEFAINIALIHGDRALLGGIYAPALDELYFGIVGNFAWCEKLGSRLPCIDTPITDKLYMAVSRFHDHPGTSIFAGANGVTKKIPVGASLKYGRLAMGEIDVYPRLVGTSEWDTAAGQAILEAAGGEIIDWVTGLPLAYGKPGRRNGQFLAFRKPYRVDLFKRTPL
jgi:3'(2'), 5'-bisphosphate nucleotidase